MRPAVMCCLSSLCSLCLCGDLFGADAKKVTYADHVLPILRDKCLGCHDPDKVKGGLNVANYTTLMQGGSSGAVIKPGDPDGSRLYQLVTHKQKPTMPPKSDMLPKESLDTIRQWIAGGALENAGSKAMVNKPKTDIALTSIVKGKPDGPPPMPENPLLLDPVVKTERANAVTALASSPWAPLVAVGSQKQVLLYHSDTLELLGVLPFPEGVPHVLKFSRNGSLLLAGGGRGAKSGRVVVWGVKTGERIFEVGEETDLVLAADISADQTQIALGGPSKMIRIYSTKDGKLLHEIKKHTDWVYSIEYSPDAVLLATADRNGGLFVWETNTAREYLSLRGHTAAVTDLSWRTDANVLASCSEDGTIRLWEMENGGNIKNWGHGAGALAVKFARDGRLVSCGRDRLVKIWDQNGAQQRAFEPLPDVVLRTVFSHDAARVIGGDWTGEIRVWTMPDGKPAGNLAANPPSAAERMEAAQKELAAREAAYKPLAAAAASSQAAAQKAAAELAMAQQDLADKTAAAKIVTEAVAKAKQAADQANAALAAVQQQVTAKDVQAKAYAEAAAKIKAEADKAKDNKELAGAAAKAKGVADQTAAELAAAQKAAAPPAAAAKTANDQLATAQRAAAVTSAAAAEADKLVKAREPAAKATAAKAAADKAASDQAAAALATARARLEQLKKAVAVVKQARK